MQSFCFSFCLPREERRTLTNFHVPSLCRLSTWNPSACQLVGGARLIWWLERCVLKKRATTGALARLRRKPAAGELPLPAVVLQALLAYRSRPGDASDEALVFRTCNGTPLASNNLRKRQLRPACLRAELAPINWHALRHTHGTLLHEQGTPLRVAQAQLGHSHLTTTLEVYIHASASAQRHAVEQLENQLFPNVPKFAEITGRPN